MSGANRTVRGILASNPGTKTATGAVRTPPPCSPAPYECSPSSSQYGTVFAPWSTKLGPNLLERAKNSTHLPVKVVLANREFEAWFLGCKESFRGFMGIRDDAAVPVNPENLDAKGRLRRNMHGTKYSSRVDQVRFVNRMDLDLCSQRCPSFRKLLSDVEDLVSEIRKA